MSDDTTSSDAPQDDRIAIEQDEALQEWATRLDTTPQQIREAVAAVGDRAADVEMHLKGTRSTANAAQEERGEMLSPDR